MIMRLQRTVLLPFLFFFFVAGARAEVSLQNPHLAVSFGGRGLHAITDRQLNKTSRLTLDEFAIAIDGKLIRSEALPAPAMTRTAPGWSMLKSKSRRG